MKVTEVKFGKKFNIGNYESEEYVVTAIIEEDESAADVFKTLKAEVAAAHSGQPKEQDETVEDRPTGKSGKGKSKSPKRDGSETVEENEVEEEVEEEIEGEDGAEEESEVGNEEAEEEISEKTAKPLKGKSKPSTAGVDKAGKKFKKKPQGYLRTNETHKEIFSGLLKAVAPDWKKDDKSKVKAKAASQKLEGVEFLDEDGNVLESFKQSVKKMMGAKK